MEIFIGGKKEKLKFLNFVCPRNFTQMKLSNSSERRKQFERLRRVKIISGVKIISLVKVCVDKVSGEWKLSPAKIIFAAQVFVDKVCDEWKLILPRSFPCVKIFLRLKFSVDKVRGGQSLCG